MSKNNIVRITAKVADIITVLPNYLVEDYKGTMGMPTLIIHVDYPELVVDGFKKPARSGKYYLTPFREYCFQVSETLNGDWDCGSSEVVDLHAVINTVMDYSAPYHASVSYGTRYMGNRSNATFHILKGLLLEAVEKFIYRSTYDYDGYVLDFEDSENRASRSLDGDVLDRFTKVCIAYLLVREKKENLIDVESGASTRESLLKYVYTLPIYNSSTKELTDLHPTMSEEVAKVLAEKETNFFFV